MRKGSLTLALGLAALGVPSSSAADPPAATGSITGTVTITKGGSEKTDRSNVAVYLENPAGETKPAKTTEIHQKDLTFTPGLIVIPVGTTIDFPNDDKVFHNVFSVSKAAKFDLGLYKSGTTKSVTFKSAGVVDVYCNIHPQMVAKIKVVDSSYYAVTAADGTFKIKGVPAGKYALVGWQANGEEYHGSVTVTAGGTASVTFSLVETDAPQRHLRKDGTPYGRYK